MKTKTTKLKIKVQKVKYKSYLQNIRIKILSKMYIKSYEK